MKLINRPIWIEGIEHKLPIYMVEWNEHGNMIGKFPWDAMTEPGHWFYIDFQSKPAFIRSIQSAAVYEGKKRGVRIIVNKMSIPGLVRCSMALRTARDGRKGEYSKMSEMKVGEVLKFAWDMSAGAPAPEYRAIRKAFATARKQKGFDLKWQAEYDHVIVTRLA